MALVTGAGRGIGAAIAIALAQAGFDIMINDVLDDVQVAPNLTKIRELGRSAFFCRADISKSAERARIVESLKNEFHRVDLLVNNAGVAPLVRTDILEATEESYDRVMSINLKGPYFLTQLVAKYMIELKSKNHELNPKIVNISSNSAYTSSPSRGEYCVSKAGVSMMTKLYADRLSEYGINVYEIKPGIMRTEMTAPVREKYDKLIAEGIIPIKRWGTPEDVSNAVVAIAKDYFQYSTGESINVDGGFHLRRL